MWHYESLGRGGGARNSIVCSPCNEKVPVFELGLVSSSGKDASDSDLKMAYATKEKHFVRNVLQPAG
jgi:hypothetical protein